MMFPEFTSCPLKDYKVYSTSRVLIEMKTTRENALLPIYVSSNFLRIAFCRLLMSASEV